MIYHVFLYTDMLDYCYLFYFYKRKLSKYLHILWHYVYFVVFLMGLCYYV